MSNQSVASVSYEDSTRILSCEIATQFQISHASRINQLHREANEEIKLAEAHAKTGCRKAYECGMLLSEVKAALPHGMWYQWLEVNCPGLAKNTASRWMQVYAGLSNRPRVDDLENLSLRQALKLLPPQKRQKPQDSGGEQEQEVEVIDVQTSTETSHLDTRVESFSYESVYEDLGEAEDDEPIYTKAQLFEKCSQVIDSLLEWAGKGTGTVPAQRIIAAKYVMGKYNDGDGNAISLHNIAAREGYDVTALSRHSAEFTKIFGVRNRAQAHGDGTRK